MKGDAEQQIWKYPVGLAKFTLMLPKGAALLSVVSHGYSNPFLYALVTVDAPLEKRQFRCILTGNSIVEPPTIGKYVDSFQRHSGGEVWHLFDGGVVK